MENKVIQYRYGAVLSVVPTEPTLDGDLFGRTILARDKDEALDYFADQMQHWKDIDELVRAWGEWRDHHE